MEPEDGLLGRGDALLVVDVQLDFCPGGALPVPDGDAVVPLLARWLAAAEREKIVIIASRDWHPREHPSFDTRGGPWPAHCVQDTPGAAYHPGLHLPATTVQVSKGVRLDRDQYSAFDATGLAEFLRQRGVRRLWVGGLAEDVCVRATVIDALERGFDVNVLADATRPLSPESGHQAMLTMREAGAVIHGRERAGRPPPDAVDEAGLESFPASDPPAHAPERR